MAGIPVVERGWQYLLDHTTEFQLKTLVTFAVHELFYWGSFLPFLILDRIPYCRRWKIQDTPNTKSAQLLCFRQVFVTHLCLVLPIIIFTHPIFDLIGSKHAFPLPTATTIILQIALFFVIEDAAFYVGHRLLHTSYLYKKVHSVHHLHSAPFGIAAEYAHPFEVLFLGLATFLGPMIVGPHHLTLLLYLGLRCVQTVECHSGYDFPWSMNRWFPGYGGADFHDHHHRSYSGNYSSTFTWVDWIMGTDVGYRKWKKLQNEKALQDA